MIIFRPKAEKYYVYEWKPSNFGGTYVVGEKSLTPKFEEFPWEKVTFWLSHDISITATVMHGASDFRPKRNLQEHKRVGCLVAGANGQKKGCVKYLP